MSKTREYHEDGSYTDRFSSYTESSVTRNADHSVRESSSNVNSNPFGNPVDTDIRVTTDGDGVTINTQDLKR